jgi:hypothetical protein
MQLYDILASIKSANPNAVGTASSMDAYTRAHLSDASMRIEKALNAQFTIGGDSGGGGGFDIMSRFGE